MTYCVKATKVGILLVPSPKKEGEDCYKLIDDIKFSYFIINESFRNTSWGDVDTPFLISQP